MTALVGILCEDGVVVGADSAATFGFGQGSTIEVSTKKIALVGDCMIIAGTGQVGFGQRFCHLAKGLWDGKKFSGLDHIAFVKMLSSEGIKDFSATHAKTGHYGCLVAFVCQRKPYLCEFACNDFQPELKTTDTPFVSLGSGQPLTDPFLGFLRKIFFPNGPPKLQDGIFTAVWALTHAIELNPGGVNGPAHIAVLRTEKDTFKAEILSTAELEEHRNAVQAAEDHLRAYKQLLGGGGEKAPPLPTPPKV